MLGDPRFAALGVRDSRLVVPYDMALDPASLTRYAPVLDLARARGVRVLVSFAASARAPRPLPSARAYARAVRAFRARFPSVDELGTWNEANHASQPTARHPGPWKRAHPPPAAAAPPPRPGGAAVPGAAPRVPRLPDRGGRRARPARLHALDPGVPPRGGRRADLGAARLRRRQPLPRRLGAPSAAGDRRARPGLAHRDRRRRALRALVRLRRAP